MHSTFTKASQKSMTLLSWRCQITIGVVNGAWNQFYRLSQMVWLGLAFTVLVLLGLDLIGCLIKVCVVLERLACPLAFTWQIRRI